MSAFALRFLAPEQRPMRQNPLKTGIFSFAPLPWHDLCCLYRSRNFWEIEAAGRRILGIVPAISDGSAVDLFSIRK